MSRHTRGLPVVATEESGLGLSTIMSAGLAARWGVSYVHLAAFAIDIDRVRVRLEEEPELPFAWEVFLVECYLLDRVDPQDEDQCGMLEDACQSMLEIEPGIEVLGSQLPFAVFDAVHRGEWPRELLGWFVNWKTKPVQMLRGLSVLFGERDEHRRLLCGVCLEAPMDPPLAPPTLEALRAMSA